MSDAAVSEKILLLEIDIGNDHDFFVNYRPGVWMMNISNLYTTDPVIPVAYLTGATVISGARIGSVQEDRAELTQKGTTAGCVSDDHSFYFDSDNRDLYVHLTNGDEPQIHTMTLGIISGFTRKGQEIDYYYYEGRLVDVPSIEKSRDPLFFGKISFEGGSATILNSDGEYDTFAESADIYGQKARLKLGFNDDEYSDFTTIFEGYIERLSIGQENMSVSIMDTRKKLTKVIDYVATAANAVVSIRGLLTDEYGLSYDSGNFNLTEWAAAEAASPNVTCNYSNTSVIDIIEGIAGTALAYFIVQDNGLYTCRIYDSTRSMDQKLYEEDLMNRIGIEYDPSEVLSSIRIGYAPVYATSGTTYTYLRDSSEETTVYNKYRVYREKTIETMLPTEAEAQAFATAMLGLSSTVKKHFPIITNLTTISREIGDMLYLPIMRVNKKMLGWIKAEIIGKSYGLDDFTISIQCRIVNYIGIDSWYCADSITFPTSLGGGDAGTWSAAWTDAQKEYASEHFGYWQDEDAISPADDDSEFLSGWGNG